MIFVAHGASSAADSGRHVKIFRRLGVSEMPVTRIGPVMAKSRTCGRVVTPSALPIWLSASVYSIGASRSSTGALKRSTNEADDALRTRLHENRRRLEIHPGRVGFRHARVDVEERDAFAVDRKLDLLAAHDAAVELPRRNRVQHHAQDVLAVRGKDVDDRDAAARADRRALDVMELRHRARHLERRLPRGWRCDRRPPAC